MIGVPPQVPAVTLNSRDITLMLVLAADADPEEYPQHEVKALIHRCRALREHALKQGTIRVDFTTR